MTRLATTPEPPYYAVIFTSIRTGEDPEYGAMAERMLNLAGEQPGFLGVDSAHEAIGITVSYWDSLYAIRQWKRHVEHREAQRLGRERWYRDYRIRIARVEREYGLE